MKLKNSFIFITLLFIIPLNLSGCNTKAFNAEDLMAPPKATGDKADIQNLIEKETGGNITLKYPKTGDYRFPIIVTDLLNDGHEEALAFYSMNNDSKPTTNVMLMNKIYNEWKVVSIFEDQGNDVDKVCFGDINEDGKQEIIIGWSSFKNTKNLINAYSYDGNTASKMNLTGKYTDFVILNLDKGSGDEIMLFTLSDINSPARAELIKYDNQKQGIHTIDVVEMDSDAIAYQELKVGKSDESTLGVFIDEALTGNQMSTEFIYWDETKHALVNPLYNKKKFKNITFQRHDNAVSRDINNDGFIEIPVSYELPGCAENNMDNLYISKWLKFSSKENSTNEICKTVINPKEKYIFYLPDQWNNKVTVKLERGILTFSEWVINQNNTAAAGVSLLSIQTVSSDDANSIIENIGEHIKLNSNNKKSYIANISQKDNSLSLNEDEIIKRFVSYN